MLNSYDIPDDPRPQDRTLVSTKFTSFELIMFKEMKLDGLIHLRQCARRILKRQLDDWDRYGDEYKNSNLVHFICNNKEEFSGILKIKEWPDKSTWWDNHDWWYQTLKQFITKSQYAIGNYRKAIKKLKKELHK